MEIVNTHTGKIYVDTEHRLKMGGNNQHPKGVLHELQIL